MKHYSMPCILGALAIAVTGCVDNDYDLSDIDSTIRIDVKDLVVPITIDNIQLESVIDIDDDDEHIKIIDGEYCYFSEGTFNSNSVNIPAISVNVPTINPAELAIGTGDMAGVSIPSIPVDLSLPINISSESTLSLKASGISQDIVTIDEIGGDMELTVKFTFNSETQTAAKGVTLKGVHIQLPSGLNMLGTGMGSYDKATGVFTVDDVECTTAYGLTIPMYIKGVEIGDRFDAAAHSFDCSTEVGIMPAGTLEFKASDLNSGAVMPSTIKMTLNFSSSNFTANTFSGNVKYSLDDVSVPDVSLDDLPDVLAQPGTNLVIDNPCIYVQVNNPLNQYGLTATSSMEITALRDNSAAVSFTPDELITIGTPYNASGLYDICLSPSVPNSYDSDFYTQGAIEHVTFSSLSHVLAGDGLPQTLKINLTDPQVPVQAVSDFALGTNYEGVNGKYKLVAPFQLAAGSTIVYSDVVDDFGEDVQKMTITALEVSLTISTNVPVAVDFTGYPIDCNGNRIGNVEIQGAKISANASNEAVTIKISGEVTGVDGIEFEAVATAVDSSSALSPDMTIELSNIRPKATGYYITEL
ncbi:MAG: hypothetical protein LIP03_07320 [Bacteroidales bacterium]|nr:hypothetical protein [Bacteroidales bacterium]